MKLTSLAFLESVENRARKVLPSLPEPAAEWRFQRFLAFHDQSGSLQVFVERKSREPQLLGVMHVREVRDETGVFLRGWVQTEIMTQPEPFVLHTDASVDVRANTQVIADGWCEELMKALAPSSRTIQQPEGQASQRLNSGEDLASP